MDRWLLNYLDEQFHEVSRRVESLREENARQIAGLRSEMMQRLEEMDDHIRRSRFELKELDNGHEVVTGQVNSLAGELRRSSDRLTERLDTVQDSVSDLRIKMSSLESPRVRDAMEGVRQVIAKYRDQPSS